MINFVVVSVILGLGYVVCHTKIIEWQRRKGKKKKKEKQMSMRLKDIYLRK